jgi:Zn-dependent metalloprotease
MTYGDGGSSFSPLTSLDVAGHEMSHGVTAATARLSYSKDAGGLNESTSDVMGTMVEFEAASSADPGDYYIGEKITRDGSYLRRMDNPSLDGASRSCWSTSVARLDPHYSSGVGNHLFYLLAEGTGSKTIGARTHSSTSCNGTSLSGIGRGAAAAIWYRGLTAYWTSTTTYPQAATGMVKGAKDLYGAGSSQCAATVAAWKAVSVTPGATCS